MRVVFMGTPPFARTVLERLIADGHEVCGVFTQPDKPGNRGKVTPSAVKECAIEHNIPVYQPVKMRDGTAFADLRALAPEICVVAAYGRILPEDMLSLPPKGCINVHASLLPRYRGAAPINWAILNGDSETGVTIMHMAKECDTGDMILIKRCPIRPDENARELFEDLAAVGADAISEALGQIERGEARRVPQNDAEATYAPMLSRELSPIDWQRGAQQIIDQIRGLYDWPCATMTLSEQSVKVFQAEIIGKSGEAVGRMKAVRRGIEVTCGDGQAILVTELQADGGKRMAASAYLNGRRVTAGTYLN